MVKKSSVIAIILLLLASTLLPPTLAQTNSILNANPGGPYTGKTFIPITFDGSGSYDTESSIVTYNWFCGDGALETGEITTHTYEHPGTYTLILTVINEHGECDTKTTTVTIIEDDPPTITILSPLDEALYFQDIYLLPLDQQTICVGPITIAVDAFDDVSIQKVELYINNKLYHTCYDEPYTYTWNKGHFSQTLKIIAYDTSGHSTIVTQEIFKWRLHPLLLVSLLFLYNSDQETDPFSWMSEKESRNLKILNILKELITKESPHDRSLFDSLNSLLEDNNDDTVSALFQFLQDHPLIKNKFIEQYPILYLLLLIDSSRTEQESSLIKDKPLLILIGSILLISSIKNKQTDTPRLLHNLFNNKDTTFLEWIRNHPYLTMGTSMLIAFLLLRSTTEPISSIDDSKDNQNRLPHANTGGPYQGTIHAPITFTAEKSYDEDGTITSFEWDFGDGETGSGKTIKHHYTTPGIFLVTLTVTDTEQGMDTDTIQVTITEEKPSSEDENNEQNNLFWIISGVLSVIMLAGFALLKFRRGFFE